MLLRDALKKTPARRSADGASASGDVPNGRVWVRAVTLLGYSSVKVNVCERNLGGTKPTTCRRVRISLFCYFAVLVDGRSESKFTKLRITD